VQGNENDDRLMPESSRNVFGERRHERVAQLGWRQVGVQGEARLISLPDKRKQAA